MQFVGFFSSFNFLGNLFCRDSYSLFQQLFTPELESIMESLLLVEVVSQLVDVVSMQLLERSGQVFIQASLKACDFSYSSSPLGFGCLPLVIAEIACNSSMSGTGCQYVDK